MINFGDFANRSADAIDTCRMFETSSDFWNEDGDGWIVFDFYLHPFLQINPWKAEPSASFYSWLITSSNADLKDNFLVKRVGEVMYRADDYFADCIDLLLKLSPARALHDNFDLPHDYPPLLLRHMICQDWKIVNLLLASGADPHHVCTRDCYSPVAESPLSLAMYTSWGFWAFRNALHSIDLDIKDFAGKELEEGRPLLDAGWQMETLTALLKQEFEPPHNTEGHGLPCDSCHEHGHPWGSHIMVQPYWQRFLGSIKNGTCPGRICSDTQDEQTFNSQRNPTILSDSITETTNDNILSQDPALSEDQAAHPEQESPTNGVDISNIVFDRNETWCIWCWHNFKETGRRSPGFSEMESSDEDDASEDDFSP